MWDWGRGDSGLLNRGGHPGDTLSEIACLSGHTVTGTLPSCKRQEGSVPGSVHKPFGALHWMTPTRPAVTLALVMGAEPAAGN